MEDTAKELSIAPETVRHQLEALFVKTKPAGEANLSRSFRVFR
jgi:hypothetical protein